MLKTKTPTPAKKVVSTVWVYKYKNGDYEIWECGSRGGELKTYANRPAWETNKLRGKFVQLDTFEREVPKKKKAAPKKCEPVFVDERSFRRAGFVTQMEVPFDGEVGIRISPDSKGVATPDDVNDDWYTVNAAQFFKVLLEHDCFSKMVIIHKIDKVIMNADGVRDRRRWVSATYEVFPWAATNGREVLPGDKVPRPLR